MDQVRSQWLAKFQEHLKKLHLVEFYQAPAQQQVANRERSNVVVQTKTRRIYDSNTNFS